MKFSVILLITCLLSLGTATGEDNPIVTTQVKGGFHEVTGNIRAAILGKGLNIAKIHTAGSILHNTALSFGYEQDVYRAAEIIEFCSVSISQKFTRKDPANIVLCPFALSVYTLTKEPGVVYISYRVPAAAPGSEEEVSEIQELIQGIIEDASW